MRQGFVIEEEAKDYDKTPWVASANIEDGIITPQGGVNSYKRPLHIYMSGNNKTRIRPVKTTELDCPDVRFKYPHEVLGQMQNGRKYWSLVLLDKPLLEVEG